jgi:hypothetical protein
VPVQRQVAPELPAPSQPDGCGGLSHDRFHVCVPVRVHQYEVEKTTRVGCC